MNQWVKIAIGLGANLGDRLATLQKAAERLSEEFLKDAVSSSVYESEPWGIREQPDFLNAVIVGRTEWKPPALVNYFKTLERELGRTTTVRNGPRMLDLDLLVYGEMLWDKEGVVVPHPGLTERDFVLLPLREVWPDWIHPAVRKSVAELTEEFLSTQPSNAKVFAPPLLNRGIPSQEGSR